MLLNCLAYNVTIRNPNWLVAWGFAITVTPRNPLSDVVFGFAIRGHRDSSAEAEGEASAEER